MKDPGNDIEAQKLNALYYEVDNGTDIRYGQKFFHEHENAIISSRVCPLQRTTLQEHVSAIETALN